MSKKSDKAHSGKRTILFISHSAECYGAQKSLLTLINNLPSCFNPIVLFPRQGPAQGLLNSGIQTHTCFYLPWLSSRKRPVKNIIVYLVNLIALVRVSRICKEQNVSLIYSNTIAVPLGLMIAKKFKVPHLLHIREFVKDNRNVCFISNEKHVWEQIKKYTTALICNSYSVASFYNLRVNPPAVSVVYNGIAMDTKEELKLFRSKNTFLMVGYIEERKNQKEAICALKILKEKGVYANLILAGGGEKNYIRYLTSIVNKSDLQKQVKFTGVVKNIDELYLTSTCLLHCATEEPWGRVVVEAMMKRCVVIASDSDGVKEIVKDSVNGLLYRIGNCNQLADLMCKVIGQQIDINKIVENAYNYAYVTYSVNNYVNKIVNVINSI